MIVQPTLRERASKAGIAPEYTDARGQIVEVKEEVLRKLLKKIGEIKSDTDSLAGRWFPVCLVLRQKAGQTEVPLPNAEKGKPIGWRLSLEDGTVRIGNATIGESRKPMTHRNWRWVM